MSRSLAARDKWRQIIQDHISSGQTVADFCRQRSVPQSSFFMWKRRLGLGRRKRSRLLQASFVAVKAIEGLGEENGRIELPAANFVELWLRQDRRLVVRRGFDRQLLAEVVVALEGIASKPGDLLS